MSEFEALTILRRRFLDVYSVATSYFRPNLATEDVEKVVPSEKKNFILQRIAWYSMHIQWQGA